MPLHVYLLIKMQQEMQRRRLSCSEVATRCDYPRSTVSEYLEGKRPFPVHFVEVFCQGLDISVEELCGGYSEVIHVRHRIPQMG